MASGLSNNSTKQKLKGKTEGKGKTVQQLLAAKVDKPVSNPSKRTFSEVSSDSNTSLDIYSIINFKKGLDEIKFSLRDLTTKDDLNEVTKDLVKQSDLENFVNDIVKKLFSKFESSLEKKLNDKLAKFQNEVQEKMEALTIENENLKKNIEMNISCMSKLKHEMAETQKIAKENSISSNYNEQYSRKNNIKVYNLPKKEKQNLRQDFIKMVKDDLKVELDERDVVAIHRLPADREPRPVIVRLFNSDVKRSLMRVRRDLKNKVKFVDDVTRRNMGLIHRLEETGHFESVWYFNCGVYGRTPRGLQLKFGLYDDIEYRLRQGK